MSPKTDAAFILKSFVVGPMAVNCYLVADPRTKEACLIDPGAQPGEIKNYIRKNGFDLKFIINTHGHGDHIAANGAFDVPVYIHKLDKEFLKDTNLNLSSSFFFKVTSPEASRLLEDGDEVDLGAFKFKVMHTPGHTPGSISLKLDGVAFTGDTLFRSGVGRTDFDYGDESELFKSITGKLFTLSDDTVIYPGHGDFSTIGEEKKSNQFFI